MTAFAAIGDDGGAGAPQQTEQLVAGHPLEYTLLLIISERKFGFTWGKIGS
jgi:hypothetical protein